MIKAKRTLIYFLYPTKKVFLEKVFKKISKSIHSSLKKEEREKIAKNSVHYSIKHLKTSCHKIELLKYFLWILTFISKSNDLKLLFYFFFSKSANERTPFTSCKTGVKTKVFSLTFIRILIKCKLRAINYTEAAWLAMPYTISIKG